MPNSITFYKGIFLHVIPVRIIVPWFVLPIIFHDNLRVTPVSFFVADFILSNCNFDIFMFTL